MVPDRRGKFEYPSPDGDPTIWGPPGMDSGGFLRVFRGPPEGPSVAYFKVPKRNPDPQIRQESSLATVKRTRLHPKTGPSGPDIGARGSLLGSGSLLGP